MELTNVKTRVVGIDIGVAITNYAVVDLRGEIIAQDSFSTLDYPSIDNYLAVLCNRVLELVEANGGYEAMRSVGVCCPSSNFLTGCIENAPNLQWKGIIPLAAMMRDRLGLAVALGNNPQCVALGEQAFGSAHGMKDFVVITLGYGLGPVRLVIPAWSLKDVCVPVVIADVWKPIVPIREFSVPQRN